MTRVLNTRARWLLPLAIAGGSTALAYHSVAHATLGPPTPEPAACELRVERSGGSIVIEGLAFADAPASGSYEMLVWQKGGGSSRIVQSGEFSLEPGAPGSLGIVSLSTSGGAYSGELTVHWDDGAVDCFAESPSLDPMSALSK